MMTSVSSSYHSMMILLSLLALTSSFVFINNNNNDFIVTAASFHTSSYGTTSFGMSTIAKRQQVETMTAAVSSSTTFMARKTTTTCLSMASSIQKDEQSSAPSVVQVKRLQDSVVEVEIPIPGSATKAAYDKVCIELSKKLTLPGFRKGSKIPSQVLEQSMIAKGGKKNSLKIQAINELITQLVPITLKKQLLEPIGQPTLILPIETLAETFQSGMELTLNVRCDVWPDIEWKDPVSDGYDKPYTGLKGTYKRKPLDSKKLDAALRDLKERYVTLEPITNNDHILAMGDSCSVNMIGYMANGNEKGQLLPNVATGDNVQVILGPGLYMEGLVEGLVGHKNGEQVTIYVTFPDKLRDKTLAGKRAIFDVDILDCSKRIVPDITDEFANRVKNGLTKDTLISELQKAIDDENSKEYTPARNNALGLALAQQVNIQVPDTLITNQAREKFAIMMTDMRSNGVSDEMIKEQINSDNFLKYKDIIKNDIIRDFKISIATDEIARLEGITVSDDLIEEQMEAIRKDMEKEKENNSEEFDEKIVRMKVENTLIRQAVMDWLAKSSQLEVIYETDDDSNNVVDEQLLEQLAKDSLQREKDMLYEQKGVVVTDAELLLADEVVHQEVVEEVNVENSVKEQDDVSSKSASSAAASTDSVVVAANVDDENMSLQEKAFAALLNAGAININQTPDDPNYDSSHDDEIASENIYKNEKKYK